MAKKKPSKAANQFLKTTNRCIHLVDRYLDDMANPDKSRPHSSDLVRAACVLAVAAMDAYFTMKFTEILVRYLKAKGPERTLVELLSKAGLDTREALTMLAMKRPYRRIRTLIERHLENVTTQRFNAIDELFTAYGLPELSKHVEARAERKTLCRSIEILVDRRHSIVHAGDYDSKGKLRSVDGRVILKRIVDVGIFVDNAESIINNLKI